MNKPLKDVCLPLAKGDKTAPQRHREKGHGGIGEAQINGMSCEKTDWQGGRYRQSDRGKHRSQKYIDRALHLISGSRLDGREPFRCQNQHGDDQSAEFYRQIASMEAVVQKMGQLLGDAESTELLPGSASPFQSVLRLSPVPSPLR